MTTTKIYQPTVWMFHQEFALNIEKVDRSEYSNDMYRWPQYNRLLHFRFQFVELVVLIELKFDRKKHNRHNTSMMNNNWSFYSKLECI